MKICLVMIVKNESHVLRRALDSVRDLVSCIHIQDTGSTDTEFDAMADIMESYGVSCGMNKREWHDFAYNRTLAMREAETRFPEATYLLMLDADDFVTSKTFPGAELRDDAYYVKVRDNFIEYRRIQLFKAHINWEYRGVVHEFPELVNARPAVVGTAPIVVQSTREGSRNYNPLKYEHDAQLILSALDTETDKFMIARYEFYLAQSYDNAGMAGLASTKYMDRAENKDGYAEERYVSYYRMAKLNYQYDANPVAIEAVCRLAQEICPQRREAVWLAMKAWNESDKHERALALWREFPLTTMVNGLFSEPEIYQWRMYDEAGIAAYYSGLYKESANLFMKALKDGTKRPLDVERLITNLGYAVSKL